MENDFFLNAQGVERRYGLQASEAESIRAGLIEVTRHMRTTLMKGAFSNVVREILDFGVCLHRVLDDGSTEMVAITEGIEPNGGSAMGWGSPLVAGLLAGGVALLVAFAVIETKVAEPMFRIPLFRIRAFSAGVFASLLASLSRGGLMFMLIIWLQGIWLPLHGYSFRATPLWAGIAMLPLTAGFLIAGPVSGVLSDRFGARPFASGGMVGTPVALPLLEVLPVDFPSWVFAVVLVGTGLPMASFRPPSRPGVTSSLSPALASSARPLYVVDTRSWVPGTSSTVTRTTSPVRHSTGPTAKRPSRIFGPCRSARIQTFLPSALETVRTISMSLIQPYYPA